MRPSQFKTMPPALFVGPKCLTAIPARCTRLRDALLQASLDPAVRAIEFLKAAVVDGHRVHLNAVVLTRDDSRYALDIIDARPPRDLDTEGLVLLALARADITPLQLTSAEIRQEPKFSNSREIWRHRTRHVHSEDRFNILRALQDEGALTMNQLEARVVTRSALETCVYSMACEAAVTIELTSALGPRTVVRSSDFRSLKCLPGLCANPL